MKLLKITAVISILGVAVRKLTSGCFGKNDIMKVHLIMNLEGSPPPPFFVSFIFISLQKILVLLSCRGMIFTSNCAYMTFSFQVSVLMMVTLKRNC